MNPWKRRFLLETVIFRFHVSFRGGSTWSLESSLVSIVPIVPVFQSTARPLVATRLELLQHPLSILPSFRGGIAGLIQFTHFMNMHFYFMIISFHFISFHFISFHFISFHFISFHFISFHFIHLFIYLFIPSLISCLHLFIHPIHSIQLILYNCNMPITHSGKVAIYLFPSGNFP